MSMSTAYQSEPLGTVLVVLPPSSPRATAGVLEAKGWSRVHACTCSHTHTHVPTSQGHDLLIAGGPEGSQD